MKIIKTISEMQAYSKEQRKSGKTIAVVPTMGYLHEGHMSLVEIAGENADIVILTLFVNPSQFGPNEDFDKYPRDFEHDRMMCEKHDVDVLFAPAPEEMYCKDASTWVAVEELSKGLCGKSRPIHFRGVTTVVTKLFNATLPDIAVFGQKDAQQALIIRRMARDLNIPVEIIVAPIVREGDGLAMSSRNKYLNTDERQNALSISFSLHDAAKRIKKNTALSASSICDEIKGNIEKSGGKVDYVEAVSINNLEPVENFKHKTLLAVAAYFGKTRLIDNIIVGN
jgi:pantoate--beta-alanine ligase